jgi:hemoglobin-like flavoprotein
LAEFLGADWTSELEDQWTIAYQAISGMMLSGRMGHSSGSFHALPVADPTPSPKAATASSDIIRPKMGSRLHKLGVIAKHFTFNPSSSKRDIDILLLRSSFEQLRRESSNFVSKFYVRLNRADTTLGTMFRHVNQSVLEEKVMAVIMNVMLNLEDLSTVHDELKRLGAKHGNYGVVATQYELFGNIFLEVIAEILKDNWTNKIESAWQQLFGVIFSGMIEGHAESSLSGGDDGQAKPRHSTIHRSEPGMPTVSLLEILFLI